MKPSSHLAFLLYLFKNSLSFFLAVDCFIVSPKPWFQIISLLGHIKSTCCRLRVWTAFGWYNWIDFINILWWLYIFHYLSILFLSVFQFSIINDLHIHTKNGSSMSIVTFVYIFLLRLEKSKKKNEKEKKIFHANTLEMAQLQQRIPPKET